MADPTAHTADHKTALADAPDVVLCHLENKCEAVDPSADHAAHCVYCVARVEWVRREQRRKNR